MISVFSIFSIWSGCCPSLKSGGDCLTSVWCIISVPFLVSWYLGSPGHFVYRSLLQGLPSCSLEGKGTRLRTGGCAPYCFQFFLMDDMPC